MRKAMKRFVCLALIICMMMPVSAFADTTAAEEQQTAAVSVVADENAEEQETVEDQEAAGEQAAVEEQETVKEQEAADDQTPAADPEITDASATEETENESEEPVPEVTTGWVTDTATGAKYYYDENGEKLTGLQTIEDAKYYFDENGVMQTGLQTIDGSKYYFQADGTAFTKGFLELTADGATCYMYFQEDGTALTGKYLYVSAAGYKADAAGNLTEDSSVIGQRYYFLEDGKAYTGGVLGFINNGKTYYMYFQSNGQAFSYGYKTVTTEAMADASGHITSTVSAVKHYYFMNNCQAFTLGTLVFTNNSKSYTMYFQADGTAFTAGIKCVTYRYQASSTGSVTLLSKNKKYYYYFRSTGPAYNSGFLTFVSSYNNKTYSFYFQADGTAVTSDYRILQYKHKADKNGNVESTVYNDGNAYGYYFSASGIGSLLKNQWCYTNGAWSYCDSTGIRQFRSDNLHKAWTKIKNTKSATSYFVVVDTKACETYTFTGSAGNWKPKFLWKCSPGKSSTPTVKGYYTIKAKGYSFSLETLTCYYYTQFYGNYLFHSILYYKGTWKVKNSRLGANLSHGCVRLATENAKWFYKYLPRGTKVYIY